MLYQRGGEMETIHKLKILTDSAKYDVACTSSGVSRSGKPGRLGNTDITGICHSFAGDGRCISLLKILQTNVCVYDCQYCINRRSNDIPRAVFTPREVAELTINFYKRNYIEGLFLSSAILKSPDHTMEMLYETLRIVREEYLFNGYIHVKAIPGANRDLIFRTGLLADRMSVNIELPSAHSLKSLAPDKAKEDILRPMSLLDKAITQTKNELTLFRHAPKFVPAGQSTQMIIGATPDSDKQIVSLAQGLYRKYKLKRVFYSAYMPVQTDHPTLPSDNPPLLREHRLYQADWLLRFYGFQSEEMFENNMDLDLNMDPKCSWAIQHPEIFPVEINTADYYTLLRVPGIGVLSAQRIAAARRSGKLSFEHLKKIGVVLKRAGYFITCEGKHCTNLSLSPEALTMRLTENKIGEGYAQLSLVDTQADTASSYRTAKTFTDDEPNRRIGIAYDA